MAFVVITFVLRQRLLLKPSGSLDRVQHTSSLRVSDHHSALLLRVAVTVLPRVCVSPLWVVVVVHLLIACSLFAKLAGGWLLLDGSLLQTGVVALAVVGAALLHHQVLGEVQLGVGVLELVVQLLLLLLRKCFAHLTLLLRHLKERGILSGVTLLGILKRIIALKFRVCCCSVIFSLIQEVALATESLKLLLLSRANQIATYPLSLRFQSS